jgi:hypothetical protein
MVAGFGVRVEDDGVLWGHGRGGGVLRVGVEDDGELRERGRGRRVLKEGRKEGRKEGGSHVRGDPGTETVTYWCLKFLLSVEREHAGPEILGHMHPIGDVHL